MAVSILSHGLGKILIRAILVIVPALLIYMLYLNQMVRHRFEYSRVPAPAQVYARPLQLYPHAWVSRQQLQKELALLNYQPVKQVDTPGSYRLVGNRIELYRRPFDFGNGLETSQPVRIDFTPSQQQIAAVTPLDKPTQHLPLLQLDPVWIDRIHNGHYEDRLLVPLAEIPPLLLQTLISVEDHRFYDHYGIDWRSISRALWQNYQAGEIVQGGSTLTQQLVKNFYLNTSKTLWRKFTEALMALLVEWHFRKSEILEAYLNEIYLGQQGPRAVHGFAMGSHFYFGQGLAELPLEHLALLVAIIRGPSYYDPRRYPQRALARRNAILDTLASQQKITVQQATTAKRQALGVIANPPSPSRHPAFITLVKRQLQQQYDNPTRDHWHNTTLITTLDPVLQQQAETSLSKRLAQLQRQQKLKSPLQGAVLITSRHRAEVLALVADRQPRLAGFNRVLDAYRPIGSLIKPAVYWTALASPGYTPDTLINDTPVSLNLDSHTAAWQPQNYDHQVHGPIPLADGLIHSYNLATVNLGLEIGLPEILKTLHHLGLRRPLPQYPALLLGAIPLSPFEVGQMYQTLADNGLYQPLTSILRIIHRGRALPLPVHPAQRTLASAPTLQLNRILQQVIERGTAQPLASQLPSDLALAGKTGTTNQLRDSWFAGFSGNRVATVWVGLDNNKPMGLTGATGAMTLWAELMQHSNPQPLTLALDPNP